MSFSVKVSITLPKTDLTKKKWASEIIMAQRRYTVKGIKKLFKQTVFGWSAAKKPDFSFTQNVSSNSIGVNIFPSGNGADIYGLVNAGSPRHTIIPRKFFLQFRPGYRAATRPGSLMSSRAYRSGKTVQGSRVNHPGFKARNFTQLIAKEYAPEFTKEMQEAINRVATKK